METEWLGLFARSLLIGLSIAAPVGPIGLLVIQRTLQQGQRIGLATGLGAAVADALYGAVGAYGVHGLIRWLQETRTPLALAGGAMLAWMAWRTWRTPLADRAAELPPAQKGAVRSFTSGRGLLAAFSATFVLTLSNPATIFSFIAIFGAMAGSVAVTSPAVMVAGVLIGSALWWLLLSAGIARLRSRFDARWQRLVNRASALVLALFALWPIASLLGGR